MPILTPTPSARAERPSHAVDTASLQGWRLVGWLGLALIIMGGADILLAWYPPAFGRPEWEFGAITATLNGLALPVLGAFLLLGALIANRHPLPARILSGVMLACVVGLLILAFTYVTVVPLALNSVSDSPQLAAGMRKAVVKASILLGVYSTLMVIGGVVGWRSPTFEVKG